jgi:cell wall-associated NlpC family hydrolase
MRRLLLASVAVFAATVLAVSVSLFAFPEISLAGDSPSQGTFTQGATAGPNEPSLVRDTRPSVLKSESAKVTASRAPRVQEVMSVARRHIGTPYRSSPPGPCRRYRSEDCSCFTKFVFNTFGKKLPDSPTRQWQYGRKVTKSDLRRGDLVFFKEAGRNRPITHDGIYSGRGNLIHASAYFGKVVESKMKYIRGYSGAKRLRVR